MSAMSPLPRIERRMTSHRMRADAFGMMSPDEKPIANVA
jgi:hypothetical protein